MASLIAGLAGEPGHPGQCSKACCILGVGVLSALLGWLAMMLAGFFGGGRIGVCWIGICVLHVRQQLLDLQESDWLKKRDDTTQAQLGKLQNQCDAAEGELMRLFARIDDGDSLARERVRWQSWAARKIQVHARRFLQQQRWNRQAAEEARDKKLAIAVSHLSAFQCMWRLRQKRRQRRWQDSKCKDDEIACYDAILAFESLAEFLRNGEIQFLQRAESHFKAAEESRYRIVAVVGLFDKGKTWLINKLFGATLPHLLSHLACTELNRI